jgi:hypothetical protein
MAEPIPIHVRLMDGATVQSRDDGTVHTIKGADGRTAAEVCVGKSTVRLNFRAAPSSDAPTGIALGGRSQSWRGGGVVVTEANLASARALLAFVCGFDSLQDLRLGYDRHTLFFKGSDEEVRAHLDSIYGTSAFLTDGDEIQLRLPIADGSETATARFSILLDYGCYAPSVGAAWHAISAGAKTTMCGASVTAWENLLRDDRQVVSCPLCRARVIASEVAADRGDDEDGSATLHAQIAFVLKHAGRPMTTPEIAEALEAAGYQRKSDGEPVRATQVAARTRNYPKLFRRDGSKIHLLG